MLLSVAMLAEDLGPLCSRVSLSSPDKSLVLSHVELFDSQVELDEHAIYIAHAYELEKAGPLSGTSHILCIGRMTSDEVRASIHDLIEVGDMSAAHLLAAVQRIFLTYNRWESTLKDIVLRRGTVADLIDATLSVVPSDILVHDRDLRTIAFRTHTGTDAENPLASFKQNEVFSREIMAGFLKSTEINLPGGNPFAIRGPHFWTSSYGTRSLSMNVFLGERCIARVAFATFYADKQATRKDVAIILVLCTYIRSLLSASFSNLLAGDRDALSVLMQKMLEGKTVSKTELETAAKAHNWDYWGDTYLMAAIRVLDKSENVLQSRYPLVSIFSRITEMVPEAHPFLFEDQGFVVVNLTTSRSTSSTVDNILRRIAMESCCDFGVCHVFTGLKRLKQAHLEATTSLAYAECAPCERGTHVFHVNDVALPLVDACIAERIPPLSFCPEGLLRLVRHDNEHKSKLYETVRAFVECNCSPTKCAKSLFIQRSTFQYRYEKALQILDMDLDDPQTQLHLRLSFRLLDTLSAHEFESI